MEQATVSATQSASSFLDWASNPLTQVLLAPLLGCLIICLIPQRRVLAIRLVALLAALLSFVFSVLMVTGVPEQLRQSGIGPESDTAWYPLEQYLPFTPEASVGMQYVQQFNWVQIRFGELQSFAVQYFVGVDSLSMPLVLLSTFILVCVVLWSWRRSERIKDFLALTLFMQVGILGSFVALDYVLLYLFWEWMLIPMFFLICGWARDREKATRAGIKFFVYTLFGSVFMLIAFIALQVFGQADVYSFSIPGLGVYALSKGMVLPTGIRLLIFLGLLLGFAVKAPMWPFHTWLPDAHSEAPTEMSVILAALMLKSGTYAYLRVLYAAFPDIGYTLGPLIAFCAVTAIVYGAGITLLQTDLKRMVAWSSISHMGFIILGCSAMNPNATMGAMFHMVGHGLIIALLFFLAGWIEERYGTRDIRQLGGLWTRQPVAGALLTLAAFAGMGFPGLAAFWGELLVLQGTYYNNPTWMTVQVPGLPGLLGFWSQVLSGGESFLRSDLWYGAQTPTGMSGARFLQLSAVVAVIGLLTSAVYMLNMLLRVVFGRDLAQSAPEQVPAPQLQPALAAAEGGVLLMDSTAVAEVAESAPLPTSAASVEVAPRSGVQLFGFEWQQGLVLLLLGALVIYFGLNPQPLLQIITGWAEVLGSSQSYY